MKHKNGFKVYTLWVIISCKMPIPLCALAAAVTGAIIGSTYPEHIRGACTQVLGAARATASSVYNVVATLSKRKAPPEKPDAEPAPEAAPEEKEAPST